ncbi:DNA polymerase I [Terriglobus tenax]|uniref:DNA polymerase I n=1 Tax=Terriglobus tenax TaxID=1111115 RepID=UPI0021DF76DF|nr:DNA polymerase I [Terriglobus tenax]
MSEDQKPAIYLLDAMAFIFRAYHAMQRSRPMSTRTGVPTAATYVFVNMINKLRRDFQPKYLAAIYDPPGPVFRDERAKEMKPQRKWNVKTQQFEEVDYAGYKANRAETPPDLQQQMPYIRRALDAFRIPVLLHEGFEADDVIGTLSCRAAEAGYRVFVVSPDKDMMQLVNEDVSILNPTKDNLVLDPAKVTEVLGVAPAQVIDVMALRGDAIDNVPGAPGIGDKGSVELIQQFGSLEAALDRAAEVKRKTYRESLENNRDNILLSKELVTIHTSVPVEFDVAAMETQPVDPIACRELFSELEFTTLLKELAPAEDATPASYILDPTAEQLTALFTAAKQGFALAVFENAAAIASEIAVEDETEAEPPPPETGNLFAAAAAPAVAAPPPSQGLRIGIAVDGHDATLIDLAQPEAAPLKAMLESESVPKSVHDLKSTLKALSSHGITLRGVQDDVMLYSYLINPTHGSHTLADIAARFSNRALGKDPQTLLVESADAVLRLANPMRDDIAEAGTMKVYDEIDKPLVPVLLKMEQDGVRIDRGVLSEMSSRLAVEVDTVSEKIYEASGHRFNINSPKQLGDVLFNKMDLPKPMKYGKGKVVSTAVDVLEELAEHHEVPRMVLEFRQLTKLKNTYLDQLPQLADSEGRIHTTFNQVGTATGRLSSINPNLQNIPVRTALGREIRAAFIAAPDNVLLSADYSQIELRLMAHFSEDPLLLDAYRTGKDIHTLTASEVFGVSPETMDKETRNRAKAVNFGIVYGISPFGLAAQLGIEQREAKLYIERYFERYQGVRRFIDATLEQVRETQKVTTLFGRVRPIPDIQSRNPNMRGFAERTAVNTPLQGTAADLIKVAMLHIDAELSKRNLKTKMTLQVHDELLFDVPQAEAEEVEALVKHEMESVIELKVPLVAETGVGSNWRDIK